MTVHSMIAGPMRCGIPTALGMQGTTPDGDEVFALGFEWPTEYASLIGSHEEQKRANERRQIDRLRADFQAGGEQDPFSSVTQVVADPPDFLCHDAADASTLGVEL